jgi:hypothetical protein
MRHVDRRFPAWEIAAVGASIVVGMAIATGRTEIVALPLAFTMIAVIQWAPRAGLLAVLAIMALPYTWGPAVPKLGTGFGVVAPIFLLLAAIPSLRGFRPRPLDWAVLAFAALPGPISYFQGQPLHLTLWIGPTITIPYFGFRLFFYASGKKEWFPPAIISVGVVAAVIGIIESLTGSNPVVAAAQPVYSPTGASLAWNVPLYRDGMLRASSTFGHPIAFGMFLLIPLAFAWSRRGRLDKLAAAVMLFALFLTLSRGPIIGAAAIIVLLGRWRRGRLVAAIGAVALAAWLVGPVHRLLLESGNAATEAGNTAAYRLNLNEAALHHLSFLGHPNTDLTLQIPGFADLTSLLAFTALGTGFVGLCAVAWIALLAVRHVVAASRIDDPEYGVAAIAVVAQLIGLLAVTLITSYQFFFWVSLAYLAARAYDSRSSVARTGNVAQSGGPSVSSRSAAA